MCVCVFYINLAIGPRHHSVTYAVTDFSLNIRGCHSGTGSAGQENIRHQHLQVLQQCVCVCVCVFFPFVLDVRLVDVSAGVTQEEGHT